MIYLGVAVDLDGDLALGFVVESTHHLGEGAFA